MLLMSPRGVPASYRTMQGFGVNTYKWVNEQNETVLVKYHWIPKQGVRSWTAADAAAVQADDLGAHTEDLRAAIERGDYPEWELRVQIMPDGENHELDFDPLDDTKVWPEELYEPKPVGRMVLDRNVSNVFAENEQIAFGTGLLVDGLDFSDDKMLVGRTFSYSDTQRHRVGPNYLQLPVNQPKAPVATNQRDGQMAYRVDDRVRTRTSTTSPPSPAGCARRRERKATSRDRCSRAAWFGRASRARTTTNRRASATSSPRTGRRTTSSSTSSTRSRSATARSRSAWSGTC